MLFRELEIGVQFLPLSDPRGGLASNQSFHQRISFVFFIRSINTHLNLLGQRDDVALVQVNNAVGIDLASDLSTDPIGTGRSFAIGGNVLPIGLCLLLEAFQ
jgi:hypothetical protein